MSSKNKSILGRKTKRSNIPLKKEKDTTQIDKSRTKKPKIDKPKNYHKANIFRRKKE